jgi:hypothetical protein
MLDGRSTDVQGAEQWLHAVGYDRDVRRPPELHCGQWRRVVHVHGERVHSGRDRMPGHADRRNLRERRGRLLLRRFDLVLHQSADVLRDGANRDVLEHVYEQLHAGADDVRRRQPGYVYYGRQRVLGVRHARRLQRSAPELHRAGGDGSVHMQYGSNVHHRGGSVYELQHVGDVCAGRAGVFLRLGELALRRAPELQGSGGDGGVRLQRGSGLHGRRQRVCELEHAGNVLDRCAELRVRIGNFAVHQWRVQRGHVLHQRVHPGSNVVHQRQSRDVRPRAQRLLGVRCAGGLRRAPELHRSTGDIRVCMQCGSGLHGGRYFMCERDDACYVCDGRAGLRVRVVEHDVWSLQHGHVLRSELRRFVWPGLRHFQVRRPDVYVESWRHHDRSRNDRHVPMPWLQLSLPNAADNDRHRGGGWALPEQWNP